MGKTNEKELRKLCKFLLTTAKRNGIDHICIGLVAVSSKGILFVKKRNHYELPVEGVKKGERIDEAIQRIVKKHGLQRAVVTRYINRLDGQTPSGKHVRQFNFEIKTHSEKRKRCVWISNQPDCLSPELQQTLSSHWKSLPRPVL